MHNRFLSFFTVAIISLCFSTSIVAAESFYIPPEEPKQDESERFYKRCNYQVPSCSEGSHISVSVKDKRGCYIIECKANESREQISEARRDRLKQAIEKRQKKGQERSENQEATEVPKDIAKQHSEKLNAAKEVRAKKAKEFRERLATATEKQVQEQTERMEKAKQKAKEVAVRRAIAKEKRSVSSTDTARRADGLIVLEDIKEKSENVGESRSDIRNKKAMEQKEEKAQVTSSRQEEVRKTRADRYKKAMEQKQSHTEAKEEVKKVTETRAEARRKSVELYRERLKKMTSKAGEANERRVERRRNTGQTVFVDEGGLIAPIAKLVVPVSRQKEVKSNPFRRAPGLMAVMEKPIALKAAEAPVLVSPDSIE
jgi:hypothetical protein